MGKRKGSYSAAVKRTMATLHGCDPPTSGPTPPVELSPGGSPTAFDNRSPTSENPPASPPSSSPPPSTMQLAIADRLCNVARGIESGDCRDKAAVRIALQEIDEDLWLFSDMAWRGEPEPPPPPASKPSTQPPETKEPAP